MTEHALLSASGAHRWLVCTKAPRLEEYVEEQSSEEAKRGTLAHSLAEIKLANEVGLLAKKQYLKTLKEIRSDPLYSDEMDKATDLHKDFCMERFNEARARDKGAVIMLEQRLDYSPWVPHGFGTSDATIISDNSLEIIDLKFGHVAVSAYENVQMKLYALGAINQFGMLYDFETIQMTISQPRLDSISSFEMSVEELLSWAEEEVKHKAELAYKGEGRFHPGDHCRFCKVIATCRAKADEKMKLAIMDFQKPPLLTDEEVVEVLTTIDGLVSWAKSVQEYALTMAIMITNNGLV
ncbi:MAG: DUF2800 domain-containing protein [Bacillaceae bacterium]|nr:DUF2800 domain-containing protein [Bacillaceae bacterium]